MHPRRTQAASPHGDTQIATVGIFAGIGAAIAAAGVAIRRRMQH